MPNLPILLRVLDIFRIGPGPSSSHTVGPMRATRRFRERCIGLGLVPSRVEVELLGSLAATGRGHGTDRAVLAGLLGWEPETVDPDAFAGLMERLDRVPAIPWGAGYVAIRTTDVIWRRGGKRDLPHPNTLVVRAYGDRGVLLEETWCSIGGGFVRREGGENDAAPAPLSPPIAPFHDGDSLVEIGKQFGSIGAAILANEAAWERHPGEVAAGLDAVVAAFERCIARGLRSRGVLPGGLGVRRRAPELLESLEAGRVPDFWRHIALAQAYAYAVNEENAAGGLVVTAPTNGASGIFPAVLIEAMRRLGVDRAAMHRALATGAGIAMVVKTYASLSGAEVGCQGEVGTATAMAAAALTELLGGSPDAVETAAEIGLEHNLGLTCDPIRGLVQAPCIERNAMGVAKAWSAAMLALNAGGKGIVSLDKVVRVMKRTGDDMMREYKETSEGGLAVAFPEC
ncbi:MAG: L-serine ammonia-lyase [Myxococcales bacterium]|nr:L-serine ammonia-lyase [Myxococcales bacterium]